MYTVASVHKQECRKYSFGNFSRMARPWHSDQNIHISKTLKDSPEQAGQKRDLTL